MFRSGISLLLAALLAVLIGSAAAYAAGLRTQRTVAGVRATINQYDSDVLAGKAKGACSLLTAKAQTQVAKSNHTSSCENVIEVAYEILTTEPKQAAAIRAYGNEVPVTLHGDTASVPKLNGGGRSTLTYTHGLWFLG